MRSPVLVIHIVAGVISVISGVAAMVFRKGSRRHGLAGNVFFVAMVVMGVGAAYLGNVVGGLLACYLVATAWLTARRREAGTNVFDWVAFLFALVVGVLIMTHVVRLATGSVAPTPGVPVGMIFFLGSVMLIAAAGDLRLLVRGGVFGRQRIMRHLWRMCFAMFMALGSFLAQRRVFTVLGGPQVILLCVVPLILMIVWLIRVGPNQSKLSYEKIQR